MMNAWEPSNINKVIGFRWSRKTMGQVNEFPLSVMDMSNKYRERWKISMKKNIGVNLQNKLSINMFRRAKEQQNYVFNLL